MALRITEQPSLYNDLHKKSVAQIIKEINDEDKKVPMAIEKALPELEKIISTPLGALGQISSYWAGCHCNHKKCESCWMQKNLWEAKR